MNVVPGPTRSVTCAFTLSCAPVGVLTQTYSPLRTPRSLASFGLISTKLSCCSSASHGLERVSSPPPSYSTRRPLVRISGNFSRDLVLDVLLLHRLVQRRQAPERLLVVVRRVLGDQVRPRRVERLAVLRNAVGEVPHHRARLGVAEGVAAVLHRHALDAARQVGLPVLALGRLLLGVGQLVPPAELLQQHVVELGIAGRDARSPSDTSRPRRAGSRRRARRRSWRGSCRRRPSRASTCRRGSASPDA